MIQSRLNDTDTKKPDHLDDSVIGLVADNQLGFYFRRIIFLVIVWFPAVRR